jgi:hypothetical protein
MTRRSKAHGTVPTAMPTVSLVLCVPAALHYGDGLYRIGCTTEPLSRVYTAKSTRLSSLYDKVLCHMVTCILSKHGSSALTRKEATDLTNELLRSTTYARPLGKFSLRASYHENVNDPVTLWVHFLRVSLSRNEIVLHVDINDELLCRYCGVDSPGYGHIVKALKEKLPGAEVCRQPPTSLTIPLWDPLWRHSDLPLRWSLSSIHPPVMALGSRGFSQSCWPRRQCHLSARQWPHPSCRHRCRRLHLRILGAA